MSDNKTAYHHHYPALFETLGRNESTGDFYKEAERETP